MWGGGELHGSSVRQAERAKFPNFRRAPKSTSIFNLQCAVDQHHVLDLPSNTKIPAINTKPLANYLDL